MNSSTNGYVSNRILKLNVGFLLTDGPGHSHDSSFDAPKVRVADDLELEYLRGPVRLSRAKEGILVQAQFEVGVRAECSRCLEMTLHHLTLDIEELYTYPVAHDTEFAVHDDGILNLAPLLRAEVLIATSQRLLCQLDCKGLCPECGANLNDTTCACDIDNVDPRLAVLKQLLNPASRPNQ